MEEKVSCGICAKARLFAKASAGLVFGPGSENLDKWLPLLVALAAIALKMWLYW
jgi:hypothetical protein